MMILHFHQFGFDHPRLRSARVQRPIYLRYPEESVRHSLIFNEILTHYRIIAQK